MSLGFFQKFLAKKLKTFWPKRVWGKAKNPSKLGFLTRLLRSFFWGFFGLFFPGQMGKITDFAVFGLRPKTDTSLWGGLPVAFAFGKSVNRGRGFGLCRRHFLAFGQKGLYLACFWPKRFFGPSGQKAFASRPKVTS